MLTKEALAPMVEHTLLDITATEKDIQKLVKEAKECGFGAICVRYDKVSIAKNHIGNDAIGIAATIGFPTMKYATIDEMLQEQSGRTTNQRVEETISAIHDGATSIDMVMDMKRFKQFCYNSLERDITSVVKAAQGRPVKVILENCFLDQAEIALACKMAEDAGAAYVKTSTGYGPGGAKIEDVRTMAKSVSESIGIKAAGGIRDLSFASALYEIITPHQARFGASGLAQLYKGGYHGARKHRY